MQGLVIVPITNDHQAFELINEGLCRRPMASQSLNPTSSRSHLIITLYLRQRQSSDLSTAKVVSKLTFVDLAGSERVNKSESKGLRLDEARAINSSLSALADAICHLKYYNDTFLFRNSKLTKSLQMSMMGQSYICVLGMVRKSPQFTSETIGTLNFIRKCKSMKLGDPTQFSYQEIYPDGRQSKQPIQPASEGFHARQEPVKQHASHGSREPIFNGTESSTDKGFLFRDDGNQSLDELRRDVSSREVGEFAQFVGMCLINISRMLKKLCLEISSPANDELEELLSERYEYQGERSNSPDRHALIQPVPEEVLIDIREAQSVPEIVSIVQGAIKLLIEQIKETSEKASSIAHKFLDRDEKSKHEQQHTLNKQYQGFLKDFSHILSKIVNQLLITKFETLSNLSDGKQTLPIMQHFVDFPIAELLHDAERTMKQIVGEDIARNLTLQLQGIIKQLLFSLTGSRQVGISELNLFRKCKDVCLQTETGIASSSGKMTKAVQAETNCRSFGAQVSDHTEQKLVGLIEAHRKLQSDRNWIIQERDAAFKQMSLKIHLLEQENAKFQEVLTENRNLKSHMVQLEQSALQEQTRFAKDTQSLLSRLAEAQEAATSLEYKMAETKQQNCNLESALEQQRGESSRLASQLADVTARLDRGRMAEAEQRELEISTQLESLKHNYAQILDRAKEALSKATEEINALKQRLEESGRNHEQLASKNNYLNAQMEQYQMNLEEAERANKIARQQVEALETRLNEEQVQKSDLEAKIKQLASSPDPQGLVSTNKRLEGEMSGLMTKVKQLEAHNQSLQQSHQTDHELTADLQSKLQSTSKDKETLLSQIDSLKTEISRLESKETEARERLEVKYKESKQSIEDYGYRIRDLEIEKNKALEQKISVVGRLEKAETENESLRSRVVSLEDELKIFTHRLQSEHQDKTELEAKLRQLESSMDQVEIEKARNQRLIVDEVQEIDRLRQRSLELERAGNELKKKYQELTIKFEKAEKEIAKKEVKIGELETAKTAIHKQVEESLDEFKRLKEEIRESKLANSLAEDKLQEKQDQITILESKCQNFEEHIEVLVSRNKELETSKHEYEHKLRVSHQESGELASQLRASDEQLKVKSNKNKEQSSKIQELTHQLSQTTTYLQQLQQQSSLTHDSQLQAMSSTIDSLNQTLEAKNMQLVELQSANEHLRLSLDEAKKDASQSHIKLKDTLKKLGEMAEESRKLSREVEDLKSLRHQLSQQASQLSAAQSTIQLQAQQLDNLTSELSRKETDHTKRLAEQETTWTEALGVSRAEWSREKEALLREFEDRREEAERKAESEKRHHANEIARLEGIVSRAQAELREREHQGVASKTGAIARLEEQVRVLEDALAEARTTKAAELETVHKQFETAAQVLRSNHANEIDVLRSQLTDQTTSFVKELRLKEEELAHLHTTLEGISRSLKDAEQKLHEKRKVVTDMEKKIEVLIGMNQQLAAKLSEKSQSELSKNKYKRSQGSIPRSDSYSKMASGAGNPNTSQDMGNQLGHNSNLLAKVSNNLITNFDKLVAADISSGEHSKSHSHHVPANLNKENLAYLSNKEAMNSRPKIPQKPNEYLKDVLVERKILVAVPPDRNREEERPSAAFGNGIGIDAHHLNSLGPSKLPGIQSHSLMPQGYMRSSNLHHPPTVNTGLGTQGLMTMAQSGTLSGLHQLESTQQLTEAGHQDHAPADPKLYSSKYSRQSRNSRNSLNSAKRSPSPAKGAGDKYSPSVSRVTP